MTGMIQQEQESSPLHHFSLMPISPSATTRPPWLLTELSSADRGLLLIHLLVNCCNHVSTRDFATANAFLEQISLLASADGDTMQRMASFFADALACRLLKSFPGVYKALHVTRPVSVAETHAVRRHFFDLCPFTKLSVVVFNKALLEAMEGEKMVHVLDLNAWDASQWIALLHMFSSREEGPPHLRITGVHEQKEVLEQTAARLSEAAEQLDVPFQFNPIVSKLETLDANTLRVKTGEALAISSILQLHPFLASDADDARKTRTPSPTNGNPLSLSLSPSTKIESFLTMLWSLSPKIMLVAENESSHNKPILTERFTEALNYYAALFDCLESTVARGSTERGKVERTLFGGEIRNIIACEGVERKARHERLERWATRMEAVGFAKVGLSYDSLCHSRMLLHSFRCDGYKVKEDDSGSFMLCWQNHPLFSVSAWNCRRFD